MEVLRRWRTQVKLERGQCRRCSRPLRDDTPSSPSERFCDAECRADFESIEAW